MQTEGGTAGSGAESGPRRHAAHPSLPPFRLRIHVQPPQHGPVAQLVEHPIPASSAVQEARRASHCRSRGCG